MSTESDGPRATFFEVAGIELLLLSIPQLPAVLPKAVTSAEREVLGLLLEGKSNPEIAKLRGVSLRTTINQVASLFRKFNVSSRMQLVAKVCQAIPRPNAETG